MKFVLLISSLLYVIRCEYEDVEGRWVLQKDKSFSIYHYPEINFNSENLLLLKSYGDTLYTGKFELKERQLVFKIGNQTDTIQIHKCNGTNLVLSGFTNTNDTLTYIRQ
ncbi:MAG: hypothetical protein KDE33_19990 [Bacteroidetes bacterium]|nr:hypothetical protein [Bacteroidota bacterium]